MSTGEPHSPDVFEDASTLEDAPTILDPTPSTKALVAQVRSALNSTQPLAKPRLVSPPPAAAPAPDLGEDRFRPLFIIGRGGMGTVEVALERGVNDFQRIVALKRMLPEASIETRHVEMFLREARLAAVLTHPNVVHAFSSGEIGGRLFLAMEYVEGEPLSRFVERLHAQEGRVAAPLVAHILAEICEGLHAAHELKDQRFTPLNLVHRDVSPHNMMVAYEGNVKLLDFGVAKIDQLDPYGGRTRTGEIKGKTSYMSPEQAMGERLDRRSDLYSMGVVLFECLAGKRMWGNGTDLETLRKLALEEPPSLAEAAPDAPPALCALHARLVQRDPAARPATAREVAEALRSFIAESGTKPDARVVRAVMGRLFGREIAARRAALSAALEEAAPGHAEELRESLVPGGYGETELVAPTLASAPPHADAPYPNDDRLMPTSPVARATERGSRSPFVGWALAGGTMGILVAAAVIGWRLASVAPAASKAPEANVPVTAAIPEPVAPTPAESSVATVSVPQTVQPSTLPTPAANTASRAVATAANPAVRSMVPSRPKKTTPSPATASTKPATDVDPTPF